MHGSQAYNLATPESDVDHKGVLVGPPAWYLGFIEGPEQVALGRDHVRYELRKFLRLAAAANPTVIEVLWTESRHHLHVSKAGERLLAARELFLSKRVCGSFGKYAVGQLKRLSSHRAWLLNPPKKEPTPKDFGLPETSLISREQLGAAEALIARGKVAEAEVTPDFLRVMDQERRYRSARKHWQQYQNWVRSRNPARAALEAAHGYDTKHAQHLVRLLKMATEILTTGRVKVWRDDREELLAIRRGVLTYEVLVERATALEREMEEAATHSTLPERADREALNALCVSLVEEVNHGA